MTGDYEILQAQLRKQLRVKQDQYKAARERDDVVDMRRKEKSIALLMTKLMCPHSSMRKSLMQGRGAVMQTIACRDCKASVIIHA